MSEIPDDIMQAAAAVSRTLSRTPLKDEPTVIAKAILAERQRQAEVMEEVMKVLEPFAEAANSYDPDESDNDQVAWAHDFQIGSLRAARALLSKLGGTDA